MSDFQYQVGSDNDFFHEHGRWYPGYIDEFDKQDFEHSAYGANTVIVWRFVLDDEPDRQAWGFTNEPKDKNKVHPASTFYKWVSNLEGRRVEEGFDFDLGKYLGWRVGIEFGPRKENTSKETITRICRLTDKPDLAPASTPTETASAPEPVAADISKDLPF